MSISTPMIGQWTVHCDAVRPFTIHSDVYFELHIRRVDDATNQSLAVRVPQHAFAGVEPTAGDRYVLTFLMGQVTAAAKAMPE